MEKSKTNSVCSEIKVIRELDGFLQEGLMYDTTGRIGISDLCSSIRPYNLGGCGFVLVSLSLSVLLNKDSDFL